MTENVAKKASTAVFARNFRVPFKFHVTPRIFILRIRVGLSSKKKIPKL
jgi:hypothetical protein